MLGAFLLSLRVGLVVALGATVAGVLAAYALYHVRLHGVAILRQYFLIPLMLPQIVTGIAFAVDMAAAGIESVVYGPAEWHHAPDAFIDIDEMADAARVYLAVAICLTQEERRG